MLVKFVKRFFYFFSGFFILLIAYFLLVTKLTNIKSSLYSEEFNNKINVFEQAISTNKKVNIVLGSSYVSELSRRMSLKNWTTFNGGGQNIYESFKFLKYYIDKTIIDTILIGINPMDFRDTISNGFVNGNSFAFGIDSTNKNVFKSKLQTTKDDIFRLRFTKRNTGSPFLPKLNPN